MIIRTFRPAPPLPPALLPKRADKAKRRIGWVLRIFGEKSESFFGTLKNEMYHLRSFPTRSEARFAVIEFIEAYYNRSRPHEAVGQRIPAELMGEFFGRLDAAVSSGCGVMPLVA